MEYEFPINKVINLEKEERELFDICSDGCLKVYKLIFVSKKDPSQSKVEIIGAIDGDTRLFDALLVSLLDIENPSKSLKSIIAVGVMLNNYNFFKSTTHHLESNDS